MREKTVAPEEIGHKKYGAFGDVWHEGMTNGRRPRMPFDEESIDDRSLEAPLIPIWANGKNK